MQRAVIIAVTFLADVKQIRNSACCFQNQSIASVGCALHNTLIDLLYFL